MNINQLMKQANQMQKKLTKLQNEYNERTFNFEAQNGQIKGVMKGNNDIVSLDIDDTLYANATKEEMLDMIISSLNATRKQINDQREKEMSAIAGNVTIPKVM